MVESTQPSASGRPCGGEHTVGLIPSNSRTSDHHHLNRAMSTQSAKIYHSKQHPSRQQHIIDQLTRRPTTAASDSV